LILHCLTRQNHARGSKPAKDQQAQRLRAGGCGGEQQTLMQGSQGGAPIEAIIAMVATSRSATATTLRSARLTR
jgi:hypothetical protein